MPEPRLVGIGPSALLTYEPYYGLREKPFSLSADPRFFYKTGSHAPAFEDLLEGIRRREGLVVLTGDIGTGKTTLCRAVLEHLDRKTFSAFVPDPFVSREDLLKMLLIDFGVMSVDDLKSGRLSGASRPDLSYPLYEFLNSLVPLQAFAVLIIDEAQNLSLPLLEEIRILSDLEGREKLLQVVLVGQLEFLAKLKLPQMRQVDQRVSVRCALEPLSHDGVAGYIMHRLEVAGGGRDRIEFCSEALDAVYRGSGGVPRLINRICDRALHRGHLQRTTTIVPEIVWAAIADLGLEAVPVPAVPVPAAPAPAASAPAVPAEVAQSETDSEVDPARRGLFGVHGTRVEVVPGDMDLTGLIDMPFTAQQPVREAVALAQQAPPSLDPDLAVPAGTLGLGRPAVPDTATRPQVQAAQPESAPVGPVLAPSLGTLGLRGMDDAYEELRRARRREIRKRRVTLVGALLAAGAAAGVGVGLWQFRGMLEELAAPSSVVYVLPPVVPPATASVGARMPLDAAPPPALPPPHPAAPAANVATPEAGAPRAYIVQVALFASLQRSTRALDDLTQAGFRAYHGEFVIGSARLHQVLVGPYATQAEAELDRDRIRLTLGFADARVAVAPRTAPAVPGP
jgi:type II secretory pathway predicted ATPase ExeA/cell division septation protein DedD